MKSLLCAVVLFSAVVCFSSHSVVAQDFGDHNNDRKHLPRYKLFDIGTLGGPHSYGSVSGDGFRMLNNDGIVSSYADTSRPDPNRPNFCFASADCLAAHAIRWKDGVVTDLGALPGADNSAAGSINERGWIAGQSQTGVVDPLLGPILHAALWTQHRLVDLGTLGGKFSIATYINDADQVIGLSDNTVADPFALFPTGFQTRAFIWDDGHMEDLGTLGGPDAAPSAPCNNHRENLVVGLAFTGFTPNPDTGIPTLDPFLWKHGHMTDLGTLGGTIGQAQCANNRGEIIGSSNLAGNTTTHAFFWDDGSMTDLGTLGGDNSEAIWINDAGEIAGSADLPGSTLHDAVLWKNGNIHDLGTVDGDACSRGRGINSHGQVVGGSSDCANFLHAFVWQKSTGMLDLNKLIAPGSGLQITNAFNINDRGEILAKSFPIGTTPNDDADLGHLVLLVPCDNDRERGCRPSDFDNDANDAPHPRATVSRLHRSMTPKENADAWRARLARQYNFSKFHNPKN